MTIQPFSSISTPDPPKPDLTDFEVKTPSEIAFEQQSIRAQLRGLGAQTWFDLALFFFFLYACSWTLTNVAGLRGWG